jgi:hypothetical protein
MQSTTFVTSFINADNNNKKIEFRYEKFIEIAKSGIQICVYIDKLMLEQFKDIELYPNVKIMNEVRLEETYHYQLCRDKNLQFPACKDLEKDTSNYIILTHSKIEFLYDAILNNPFNSSIFAWIDFSIAHVFNDINQSVNTLKRLGQIKNERKFLAIPGCVDTLSVNDNHILIQQVYWRFCGGFFIGDRDSIVNFYHLCRTFFPIFIDHYKTLVWEVNFWSWLETNTHWKPTWYLADHNDSIIQLPEHFYAISLSSKVIKQVYPYPPLERDPIEGKYSPGSASYLNFNEKHILNTRYVNYTIENNTFNIHNENGYSMTKNVVSILDNDLIPINYQEVEDPPTSNGVMMYNGIEDIRLYEYMNEIHFVGTSLNHSTLGRNLIVTGKYDGNRMIDCRMIEPPNDSWCEKNWTPIIQTINGIENEYFIYKWFPMEIGRINTDNKLIIEISHEIQSPLFRKFRGSTTFTPLNDVLIGVVHYSEGEFLDRQYFHVLVMLDSKTLKPIKHSQSFYFGPNVGIEFCIGFTIIDSRYQFWISTLDGNPSQLSINIDDIPFCFDV